MIKRVFLMTLCVCFLLPLSAQSWKKLRKQAEQAEEDGNYLEAAKKYKAAWRKKKKKEELIFKAGEAYYIIRDYSNAADAYKEVKGDTKNYPLAGLKYARSLKQQGKYDEAGEEFLKFYNDYNGPNKSVLQEIIQTEIKGCDLGKQFTRLPNTEIKLDHMKGKVNSRESDEFAPFPFKGDEIYYSTTAGGQARVYQTRLQVNQWTAGVIPQNFPLIQSEHYCNGTLSPDGRRFYFTICSGEGQYGSLTSRCEIFVIKRGDGTWSQPERLPDIINMESFTATHPYVVHQGGMELLYYASNRDGGQGGMDLWYVSRDLGNDDIDFTYPVNLGPTVNTLGDELSPFFDQGEGILYFASNGHITIGGFDIFKAPGSQTNWSPPNNVGAPLNSCADDYFYIHNARGTGGFLVSNRTFPGAKPTTIDDDIFTFISKEDRILTLAGNVYDDKGEPLINGTMNLYEVAGTSGGNLIFNMPLESGRYNAQLLPNRRFRVEVTSVGYRPSSYEFTTDDPNRQAYGEALYLQKDVVEDLGEEELTPINTTDPKEKEFDDAEFGESTVSNLELMPGGNTGDVYTMRDAYYELTSNAPRYKGVYYKVQLIALRNFKPESSAYDDVRILGNLEYEYIVDRNLNRVLLAPFASEVEAEDVLSQARDNGFPKAYLVKYEDGERVGRVRR